jgi:hypothetical protein
MIVSDELSEQDREMMARYNITTETKTVFCTQGYKYDKLKQALNYARTVEQRAEASDDE